MCVRVCVCRKVNQRTTFGGIDTLILEDSNRKYALLILNLRYRMENARRAETNDCRINYDGILTSLGITDVSNPPWEKSEAVLEELLLPAYVLWLKDHSVSSDDTTSRNTAAGRNSIYSSVTTLISALPKHLSSFIYAQFVYTRFSRSNAFSYSFFEITTISLISDITGSIKINNEQFMWHYIYKILNYIHIYNLSAIISWQHRRNSDLTNGGSKVIYLARLKAAS